MDLITAILIGIGLSADCFAVAVCITSIRKIKVFEHFKIPFHFGVFHFVMILIGYYLGVAFEKIIKTSDHWIAAVLLFFIGGKIVYESIKDGKKKISIKGEKELLVLSFATSIDALVLGIALSIINGNIYATASIIAATVFAISLIGLETGERIGKLKLKYIEVAGGLVLIAIGLKILVEHLFF